MKKIVLSFFFLTALTCSIYAQDNAAGSTTGKAGDKPKSVVVEQSKPASEQNVPVTVSNDTTKKTSTTTTTTEKKCAKKSCCKKSSESSASCDKSKSEGSACCSKHKSEATTTKKE